MGSILSILTQKIAVGINADEGCIEMCPPPLMVFLEPSIFIGIQSYFNQTLNYNNRNRVYNYQSEKNSGVMYTKCDNAPAPCYTECNKEEAHC